MRIILIPVVSLSACRQVVIGHSLGRSVQGSLFYWTTASQFTKSEAKGRNPFIVPTAIEQMIN